MNEFKNDINTSAADLDHQLNRVYYYDLLRNS